MSYIVTLVLTDRLLAEDEVTWLSVWHIFWCLLHHFWCLLHHFAQFAICPTPWLKMTCLVVELTDLTHLTISYTEWSIVRGYRVIISQWIQGDPYPRETDFWTHIFCGPKCLLDITFFRPQKFWDLQIFQTHKNLRHNNFQTTFFFTDNVFLDTKLFYYLKVFPTTLP